MPEAPIGVLGGTFDPVHSAHVALAELAQRHFGLERILWIPAGQPRHRGAPRAPGQHRLAMVQQAIAGHAGFELDDAEVLSTEPSYTVPTLERLRRRFGTVQPLVLLLGADAFLGLTTWHRWREVLDLAHVAVATRPGFTLEPTAMPTELAEACKQRLADNFSGPAGSIRTFRLVAGTVSATETRNKLAAGIDPGDWLPPGILDYIRTHHLYGT